MTTRTLIIPAALLTAMIVPSGLAFAGQQRERRGRDESSDNRGQAAERAVPRRENAAPQAPQAPQPQPQREERRQPDNSRAQGPQAQAPRVENRRDQSRRDADVLRAVPRREAPRPAAPRNDARGYESRGYRNDRPTIVAPRGRYAPYGYGYSRQVYVRPYVFRPWFSIGFGIFAGYPVPYAYSYPYPIAVYGYSAPRALVNVGPGSNLYGGVSLEISPYDADVFVDGTYAGKVEDFDGTEQPLTLVYGTHRIEVQAPGYAPLVVDVAVQPGQVIPYRGDLRRY